MPVALLSIFVSLLPRRFVYLLRLKPEDKIVRGLHDYHPEEPVRKPGWAEAPKKPVSLGTLVEFT